MRLSAYLILNFLFVESFCSASLSKRTFTPTVKSATVVGNVADPSINRDSCGSTRIGHRTLWTCRDSQPYGSDGIPTLPIWSSSASWSNFSSGGKLEFLQYGGDGNMKPYFPYKATECGENSAGICSDGTRFALWPDSPPLVTSIANNVVTAYTWIRKQHINRESLLPSSTYNVPCPLTTLYFSVLDPDPATSLYKLTYDLGTTDWNILPTVSFVKEEFWPHGSIPYGAYGNVIKDKFAYLFGQPSNGKVALARVPTGAIEDYSQYQFWFDRAWRTEMPNKDDATINIPNVSAGGQGTYYFSTYWNKWVWIGQAGVGVSADFFITTADLITGPWESPVHFYSGKTGSFYLGAYTLQAHPGLSSAGSSTNEIYISYTKNDVLQGASVYSTPLIHIKWN